MPRPKVALCRVERPAAAWAITHSQSKDSAFAPDLAEQKVGMVGNGECRKKRERVCSLGGIQQSTNVKEGLMTRRD